MKVIFKVSFLPVVIVAAVGLRLWAAPHALDATDDVNFALALERFDLALHQPHFPGYPLYVLAARLCRLVFATPLALPLPGILATPLLIVSVYRVGRARLGEGAARMATALVAVAPTAVATSSAASSDGLALAFAAAAFAMPLA